MTDTLVTSRLSHYEVWNRLFTYRVSREVQAAATELLTRAETLELNSKILARALDPYPVAVRTLDGLHLASLDYLRRGGQAVKLATLDRRMSQAATAMRIPLFSL